MDYQIKKQICLSILVGIFSILNTYAHLSFNTQIIEDEISEDSNTYPFEFKFKNTGNNTINITNISTTCGCTIAKCDKNTYKPNENGTISGVFSLGDKDGIQEKTITVDTNDIENKHYILTLKIAIKRTIIISPRILIWRIGSSDNSKTIKIQSVNPIKISSIICDSDNFVILKKENKKDPSIYITPKSTNIKTNSKVKITILDDTTKNTINKSLFLLIK